MIIYFFDELLKEIINHSSNDPIAYQKSKTKYVNDLL